MLPTKERNETTILVENKDAFFLSAGIVHTDYSRVTTNTHPDSRTRREYHSRLQDMDRSEAVFKGYSTVSVRGQTRCSDQNLEIGDGANSHFHNIHDDRLEIVLIPPENCE